MLQPFLPTRDHFSSSACIECTCDIAATLCADTLRLLPQFFKTNMDDMSDAEKIKSPVVIGGLALLIAPFLAGVVALAFYR